MSRVVNLGENSILENNVLGKKCGDVTISVYEGIKKGEPFFFIHSDSIDVLPVSYVIEDTLYSY